MLSGNQVSVFCADVGSIPSNRFAWAGTLASGATASGCDILELSRRVADELVAGRHVALGFECPLFVPLETAPRRLARARKGEGNRPWSAAAGCGSMATGVAQASFVLSRVRELAPKAAAFLHWPEFAQSAGGLLLWEAFVSGSRKTGSHDGDAAAAVHAFVSSLHDPDDSNVVREERVLSLIGAVLLRTGWHAHPSILDEPCLVIRAGPKRA